MPLLEKCGQLTRSRRALFLLTCHTPGFGPAELEASLADTVFGHCQAGVRAGRLQLAVAGLRQERGSWMELVSNDESRAALQAAHSRLRAGHLRGHATDLGLAFPRVFLILLLVAFTAPSPLWIVAVLGLTGWMSVARLVLRALSSGAAGPKAVLHARLRAASHAHRANCHHNTQTSLRR